MAFSFVVSPQDYLLRAQAGLPLDPSLTPDQVSAQAGQALSAPPPQAAPAATPASQPLGIPDIPVSRGEAVMAWLAHGGTPGEAAQHVRATKLANMLDGYQIMQAEMRQRALQSASPDEQRSVLYGDSPMGKALADRFATHALKGGETLVNGGPGGAPVTATTYGIDNGVGYALGPSVQGGLQMSQGRLPGETKVDAESGGVYNNNGPTGQAFSRWRDTPPGNTAGDAFPGVRGVGNGGFTMPPNGGQAPPASAAASLPGANAGQFDPLGFIKNFILPHEGGLNPHDMNGAPTKYGINQTANPGVDVAHLTPDQATQIYMRKYLPASGAADLSPALGAVHLDTSIINPARAQQFLTQSGGDPVKYLQLREAWMQHLVQTNPSAAPYAKAWATRNADLAALISAQGAPAGQGASQASHGGADIAPTFTPIVQGATHDILPPTDPLYQRYAPGTVLKRAPNGEITADTSNAFGPQELTAIRGQLQNEEPIKNWRIANTAYGAMVNAAAQPNGGMRAYSLRDTFARLINPGAVARVGTIQALKEAQGVPANIQAYLLNLKGDGDVPPQIAQQILDVGRGFLSSHYAQAKATNDNYSQFAQRHHVEPADVAVPIGDEPPAMHIGPVPPPPQRRAETIYATPKGPLLWKGSGWAKIGY